MVTILLQNQLYIWKNGSAKFEESLLRVFRPNPFIFCLLLFRFSCATREGQANNQYNFDNERRVWDGRTIKRKVKGGSALYLILEDEVHTIYKTIITSLSFEAYHTLYTFGFSILSFSLLSVIPFILSHVFSNEFSL